MNFALLAPLGLAALAALALPLLIHLIRRLDLRTTEFAALRWISPRIRPRRRLRFERPWLLLLRLLLLALLALLLARPVWIAPQGAMKPWVVVAPGVDRATARAAVPQSNADWHWLAPGFPTLDTAPSSSAAPVASLLRELDADLPTATALTVVVPDQLAGLDGERLRLAHALDWRVVPGRMGGTAIDAPGTPIRFALRYAPGAEPSLGFLRAAVAAWNTREPGHYELDAQPLSAPIADDARWLAWLAPDLSPQASAWIEHGGVALVANHALQGDALWRDATGNVLARSATSGRGRLLALPGALTPASLPLLLDADFPERLLAALQGPPTAPTRAAADAVRPLHDTTRAPFSARARDAERPLDPWLALLIALLFLIERLVATRRHAEAMS